MSELRCTDTEFGEAYWSTMDHGDGYRDSVMHQDLAHEIWELLVPDRTANVDRSGEHQHLDMGCAFGYMVRHMRRRGVESYGVDISDYALEHAPEDVKPFLQRYDLRSGNPTFYGWSKFTIVTCFETMEHIDEGRVPTALRSIHQSLVPGGVAVLTICVDTQPGWETDPTHVTVRSRGWWSERLAEAEFVPLPQLEQELRRWWLFSAHGGVFVCQRLN